MISAGVFSYKLKCYKENNAFKKAVQYQSQNTD